MCNKIRVLIVDDEYIVRQDIKNLINWEALGFTIVGEATNGKQGLEIAVKYKPEIIITDIKMPVMDGLTMAQKLLQNESDAQFILLTAYDEFDLARKAMKMNINHYLLKHEMDSHTLLELLQEIKPRILSSKKRDSEGYIQLIKSLLLGAPPNQLKLKGQSCALLLMENSVPLSQTINTYDFVELLYIFDDGEHHVFIAIYSQISELLYRSSITNIAKQLSASSSTVVHVSAKVDVPNQLYNIYITGKQAMTLAPFVPSGCGVLLPEVNPNMEIDRANASICLSALRQCLQQKNLDGFENVLSDYINNQCIALNKGTQFTFAQPLFAGVLGEYNEGHHLLFHKELDPLYNMKNAIAFLNYSCSLAKKMITAAEEDLSPNMRRVLRYINKNFQQDIGLDDIASILSMNSMYAGQLFKKEVGISFKQFLSERRIEEAKSLLLGGEHKIYEISAMVGYQTTQYFCSIFKKITGVSPSDYTR